MKNKIEEHETKYWHIKKPTPEFILTVLCIVIFFIGLSFLYLTLESLWDVNKCKIGMLSVISEIENPRLICYANDDFFKFNFGHNLECSCFYWDSRLKQPYVNKDYIIK